MKKIVFFSLFLALAAMSCTKDDAGPDLSPSQEIDHAQAQHVFDFVNQKSFTKYFDEQLSSMVTFNNENLKIQDYGTFAEVYQFDAEKMWCHKVTDNPSTDGYYIEYTGEIYRAQIQLLEKESRLTVTLFKDGEEIALRSYIY